MFLLTDLVLALLKLLLILLDLAIVAVLIRPGHGKWSERWMKALDEALRPLADLVLETVERWLRYFVDRPVRSAARIVVGLLVLLVVRLLVIVFIHVLR